jgi:hypothetical protein
MSRDNHVKEMALVRQHVGPASEWVASHKVDPEIAAYKAQLEEVLRDWSPESRRFERVQGHDQIRAINAELARLDPNTKKIRSDISDRKLEEKVRNTYSKRIPETNARLQEIDGDPAPVPADGETFTLNVAGEVVDSTISSVEGEGTTYRQAIDSFKDHVDVDDEVRLKVVGDGDERR